MTARAGTVPAAAITTVETHAATMTVAKPEISSPGEAITPRR